MIDTKALREKVLDLAIRGKLVPQDPNDEPASVLLERIRAEKQQMVKDGKLKAKDIKNDTIIFKGDDNLHYEQFQDGTVKCIQDEIPFDLPDGWVWCYLPQIAQSELGKTLDKAKNTGEYHPYIRSINVLWGKLDLSDLKQMRFENSELDKYAIRKNDLLICEGGDVGRCCIWDKDYSILYQNAIHRVRFYNDINPEFYMYVLMLYEHKGILKRISNGVTIKHLTGKVLSRLPIPLPSLHDQNNIVQIIKFMLSQIDSIESIYNELSIDISIIKSKILDLAIRGKLVPQNPDDEPASAILERIRAEKEELIKQGKIKRDKKESVIFKGDDNSYYEKIGDTITDITDEIPYEIPDSWCWSRLKDLCVKEIKRGKAPKYTEKSGTLVFAQKCNTKKGTINLSLAQYLDESLLKKYNSDIFLKYGDIIINSTGTGTLGRVGVFEDDDDVYKLPIVPDSHISTIRIYDEFIYKYIYFCVKSNQPYLEQSGEGSTNQKELRPATIENMLIPLPPVCEQERVVCSVNNTINILTAIEKSLV